MDCVPHFHGWNLLGNIVRAFQVEMVLFPHHVMTKNVDHSADDAQNEDGPDDNEDWIGDHRDAHLGGLKTLVGHCHLRADIHLPGDEVGLYVFLSAYDYKTIRVLLLFLVANYLITGLNLVLPA